MAREAASAPIWTKGFDPFTQQQTRSDRFHLCDPGCVQEERAAFGLSPIVGSTQFALVASVAAMAVCSVLWEGAALAQSPSAPGQVAPGVVAPFSEGGQVPQL